MNPEIKQRWIAALRSGDYKQTTNRLRANNMYCCLGVLCDIHSKTVGKEWSFCLEDCFSYMGEQGILPMSVLEWAGLDAPSEGVQFLEDMFTFSKITLPDGRTLADLNDNGASFDEIADIIEREL